MGIIDRFFKKRNKSDIDDIGNNEVYSDLQVNKKFLGRIDDFPFFKKREFEYDAENGTIYMRCCDSYSDKTEYIISEEKFFMYIEHCRKYYDHGYGNYDSSKSVAEKYLLLKHGVQDSYMHSILIFQDKSIEVVLHYDNLVLRNLKEYDKCGEEVTVLMSNAEKKDVNYYTDFIFHSLNELYDNEISQYTVNEGVIAADLPECIRDLDFTIDLRKCCTLSNRREVLEHFVLHKQKYNTISADISIGFGYSVGSHNPGVGWSVKIPGIYFKNCDMYGLSQYIARRFNDSNIYLKDKEICKNDEIITLFELIRES